MGGNDLNFSGVAANCVSDTLAYPLGNGPNDNFDCLGQDSSVLSTMGYNTSGGSPHDGAFMPPKGNYQRVQQLGVPGPLSDPQLAAMTTSHNGTDGTDALVKSDVHDALVELYRTLKAQAPGARILVLGYPHFFQQGGSGDYCEYFSNLEQQWVNDRIAVADSIIQDAVAESGVAEYVDTYNALTDSSGTNHQECTGSNGGPNVDYSVDASTDAVGPCTGNWINPIDVPAVGAGKLPGNVAVATPEVLHPNPCGHQAEGNIAAAAYGVPPIPLDTFSIAPGQAHTTSLVVPSGIDRLNLGLQWPTGSLGLVLTDPSQKTYQPVQEGPNVAGAGGAVVPILYATWDVPHPVSGTWQLKVTNETMGDQGVVHGTVTAPSGALIQMPPGGQLSMLNDSCGVFTCTATFKATVAHPLNSAVSSYSWFDDQGNPQSSSGPKADTMTMTSATDCYRVILRTNGSGGQDRFTTLEAGSNCRT
jgi:hypothetical protein